MWANQFFFSREGHLAPRRNGGLFVVCWVGRFDTQSRRGDFYLQDHPDNGQNMQQYDRDFSTESAEVGGVDKGYATLQGNTYHKLLYARHNQIHAGMNNMHQIHHPSKEFYHAESEY